MAHKRTGPHVGRLQNRKGWYVIWFESRENKKVLPVVANPDHGLALAPSLTKGVLVLETPPPSNPFAAVVAKDDIILGVGTTKVNTPDEFTKALAEQNGTTTGIKVNKGGRTGGGRRSEKAGDSRDTAENYFTWWLQNRDRRVTGLEPLPEKASFANIADAFIKWAQSPAAGYSPAWFTGVHNLMKHYKERWGHFNADEITPAILADWFDGYSSTVAPSTAANALKPLRKCFDLAVERGYLKENPAKFLKIKQQRQTTPKYLTMEQIALLIECAQIHDAQRLMPRNSPNGGVPVAAGDVAKMKRYYNSNGTFDSARIQFLLLTALRKSQLTSLTWHQYDPARGTITLESSADHTEKSKRVTVIPLPNEARQIVAGQPENSRFIFPNLHGDRDDNIHQRFERIADLVNSRGGGHVTLHMLRHTALTYLLAKTGDIAAVQAYAGHADVRMTQRYAHILPSKLATLTSGFSVQQMCPQQSQRSQPNTDQSNP